MPQCVESPHLCVDNILFFGLLHTLGSSSRKLESRVDNNIIWCSMKPLITDALKGVWTTSVSWIKSMPLIALPIEIVHLEPLRSGHLSTPDSGQPACLQNNLWELTDTKTTSTSQKLLLTFVAQILCPLLCLVDFCPFRTGLIETCWFSAL